MYTLKRKSYYSKNFVGSSRLFDSCWRVYSGYLAQGAIDSPKSDADVYDWLDSIASEKVNSSSSSFFIYG